MATASSALKREAEEVAKNLRSYGAQLERLHRSKHQPDDGTEDGEKQDSQVPGQQRDQPRPGPKRSTSAAAGEHQAPRRKKIVADKPESGSSDGDSSWDASHSEGEESSEESDGRSDVSDVDTDNFNAAQWHQKVMRLIDHLQTKDEWEMMSTLRRQFMVRDSERSLDNERMTLLEHARDSEGAAFDHVDGSLEKDIDVVQMSLMNALSTFTNALAVATEKAKAKEAAARRSRVKRFTFEGMKKWKPKRDRSLFSSTSSAAATTLQPARQPTKRKNDVSSLLKAIAGQQNIISDLQFEVHLAEKRLSVHQQALAHVKAIMADTSGVGAPEPTDEVKAALKLVVDSLSDIPKGTAKQRQENKDPLGGMEPSRSLNEKPAQVSPADEIQAMQREVEFLQEKVAEINSAMASTQPKRGSLFNVASMGPTTSLGARRSMLPGSALPRASMPKGPSHQAMSPGGKHLAAPHDTPRGAGAAAVGFGGDKGEGGRSRRAIMFEAKAAQPAKVVEEDTTEKEAQLKEKVEQLKRAIPEMKSTIQLMEEERDLFLESVGEVEEFLKQKAVRLATTELGGQAKITLSQQQKTPPSGKGAAKAPSGGADGAQAEAPSQKGQKAQKSPKKAPSAKKGGAKAKKAAQQSAPGQPLQRYSSEDSSDEESEEEGEGGLGSAVTQAAAAAGGAVPGAADAAPAAEAAAAADPALQKQMEEWERMSAVLATELRRPAPRSEAEGEVIMTELQDERERLEAVLGRLRRQVGQQVADPIDVADEDGGAVDELEVTGVAHRQGDDLRDALARLPSGSPEPANTDDAADAAAAAGRADIALAPVRGAARAGEAATPEGGQDWPRAARGAAVAAEGAPQAAPPEPPPQAAPPVHRREHVAPVVAPAAPAVAPAAPAPASAGAGAAPPALKGMRGSSRAIVTPKFLESSMEHDRQRSPTSIDNDASSATSTMSRRRNRQEEAKEAAECLGLEGPAETIAKLLQVQAENIELNDQIAKYESMVKAIAAGKVQEKDCKTFEASVAPANEPENDELQAEMAFIRKRIRNLQKELQQKRSEWNSMDSLSHFASKDGTFKVGGQKSDIKTLRAAAAALARSHTMKSDGTSHASIKPPASAAATTEAGGRQSILEDGDMSRRRSSNTFGGPDCGKLRSARWGAMASPDLQESKGDLCMFATGVGAGGSRRKAPMKGPAAAAAAAIEVDACRPATTFAKVQNTLQALSGDREVMPLGLAGRGVCASPGQAMMTRKPSDSSPRRGGRNASAAGRYEAGAAAPEIGILLGGSLLKQDRSRHTTFRSSVASVSDGGAGGSARHSTEASPMPTPMPTPVDDTRSQPGADLRLGVVSTSLGASASHRRLVRSLVGHAHQASAPNLVAAGSSVLGSPRGKRATEEDRGPAARGSLALPISGIGSQASASSPRLRVGRLAVRPSSQMAAVSPTPKVGNLEISGVTASKGSPRSLSQHLDLANFEFGLLGGPAQQDGDGVGARVGTADGARPSAA